MTSYEPIALIVEESIIDAINSDFDGAISTPQLNVHQTKNVEDRTRRYAFGFDNFGASAEKLQIKLEVNGEHIYKIVSGDDEYELVSKQEYEALKARMKAIETLLSS